MAKLPLSIDGFERFAMPWWLLDLKNFNLILNRAVPTEVTSEKSINYVEILVPGGASADDRYSNMGSETISFSIPIINFNNTLGNYPQVSQFRLLRQPAYWPWELHKLLLGFTTGAPDEFREPPRVYLMWGTGNLFPLEYKVTQCSFTNAYMNGIGMPRYTVCNLSFKLVENGILYSTERIAGRLGAIFGFVQNTQGFIFGEGNPYRS